MTSHQRADGSAASERAVVIGLEGASIDLLREWARAGELPTFARLFEEGASGPLETTLPATEAVAWPSITTGCRPDAHGVYGTHRLTPSYERRRVTRGDVSVPYLWDHVSPAIVANVPVTYPARDIEGKMVAGPGTPSLDGRFATPASLRTRIEAEIPDYVPDVAATGDGTPDESQYRSAIERTFAARRELLETLLDEPDWRLFCFVFTAPERLQRVSWRRDVLREHYRALDEILATVLRTVRRHDATLYVVSSHGFEPVDAVVDPNAALRRAGHLTTEHSDRLGSLRDRARSAGWVPTRLANAIPGENNVSPIAYQASTAFVHDGGSVYVNDAERFSDGTVPASAVDDVAAEIARELRSYRAPATGDQPFTVHDGRDRYPRDERAPDLLLEPDGHALRSGPGPDTAMASVAAARRSEGLLLAWGSDVAAGERLVGASVTDVAPTLLYGLGEPVPEHVDGQVRHELFASRPASARVQNEAETTN